MSTDNSLVLNNESTGRSYFDISRKTHTSQKLGSVSVSDVQFCLPHDTIKHSKGQTYELKPTTHRIVSKLYGSSKSVAVPIRQVWKYFPEFIAKNKHFIEGGGFNTTYMMRKESETASYLPYVNPAVMFGCFLSAFGSGDTSGLNHNLLWAHTHDMPIFENDSKMNGNAQTQKYQFIDTVGLMHNVEQYTGAPWWLPRLCGDGFLSSGVNCNLLQVGDTTHAFQFTFTAPEIVNQAKLLFELVKANNPSTTFSLQTNEITAFYVVVYSDGIGGGVNYYCAVGSADYGNSMAYSTYNNMIFNSASLTDTTHNYGQISLKTSTTDTYGSGEFTHEIVPILYDNALPIAQYAFSLICTAFFNRPELLGRGSLLENLGVHLFDYKNMYDIFADYVGDNVPVGLGVAADALFPVLDINLVTAITNFRKSSETPEPVCTQLINVFPFLAYQKFATERLLLPHNVLSNNQGENTDVDFAPYDSPFYRNNMVPTSFWGKPTSNGCILLNSSLYVEPGSWDETSTGSYIEDPVTYEYKMPINQILTIFLNRGVLLDMDVFTRIWQKQNENVDNILQASAFGAVNDNRTINAKLFLLAKKLGRYVRFGNTDQTIESVYARHFGVNDLPKDTCNSILLSSDRVEIDVTDVLNQGGAVDQNGDARMLGDRSSIVTKSVPLHHDYQCYCPEFCYILDLHWFSCEFLRTHVPEPNLNWIGRLCSLVGDMRRNFQLMFFSEYQDCGDEMLYYSDIVANAPMLNVAWSNKNQTLKDGYNDLTGEFRSKYYKMVITPYPEYKKGCFAPSLTYGYLQPTPYQYDLHLIDRFGDAFLVSHYRSTIRKSTMTKTNSVGLNI